MSCIGVQYKWAEPHETGGRTIEEYQLDIFPPPGPAEEAAKAQVTPNSMLHGECASIVKVTMRWPQSCCMLLASHPDSEQDS